jgi:hypothetical protein
MSWGTELWDKYEDLCSFSSTGIDFLEKSVAEFIKERGKLEKEYAKSLRILVRKYVPKCSNGSAKGSDKTDNKGDSGPASISIRCAADEEFTHLTAYKEVRCIPGKIIHFFLNGKCDWNF